MSAKDMVQINNISNLLDLGIASFKIEGRMKSLHYIATVVNTYRKAMDNYYHNHDINFSLLTSEINNAANRETDTAWYFGSPNQTKMLYHDEQKIVNQNYAFIIMNHCNDFYEIQTKNKIYINQEIEIISPDLASPLKTKITFMKDVDNNLINVCPTPMTKLFIQLDTTITLNYPAIARILSTNITQTKIHD
ncbi:U32 family peptidase C-terminal domain-containing protein [bacterium]|nr:U32 family peptidase C-terminal domain-containing protein [bacterium]MBR2858234.1 U32 family peptidase C-terminal domain-containing protein [bacterium]